MNNTNAYAAQSPTDAVAPFSFQRRDVQAHDVQIDILYCGVCHSDIHQARNEWGGSIYPMVPGHEIVGRVIKTGDQVTKFKAGELVGVGCFVDSCRECPQCKADQEQYCEKGMSPTYNGYEQDRKNADLWRLLHSNCGRRKLRPESFAQTAFGRRRAAPLRRHYHLLAIAPLECGQRT